ncbi:DUF350 domain-containing protein [Paenibacillus sp. 1001270B_150601_E10]|uniref:DUF350 domain-containing protein n=1 Tax=Paenibacillus sp. 1001270B_150601_E10 TaxID=2787079 RepID=UPI003B632D02
MDQFNVTLQNVQAIGLWTGISVVLLFILMCVDSFFTSYNDIREMKKGNVAVTTRFVMKLFAQGYILSTSIRVAYSLWEALIYSVIAFVILLIIEWLVRLLLKGMFSLNLEEGTKNGMMSHALLAGSLHVVGAFIIAACL